MRGIFVHFHNPISLSEYYWINTLVYGHAVQEFQAFVERPNLLYGICRFQFAEFFTKKSPFQSFSLPHKGEIRFFVYICRPNFNVCRNYANFAIV